tara:strand:- start:7800 stop:8540 length:741 start_codon:yes stop_codon:yes gene_type:complete
MLRKIISLLILAFTLVSCQFTETMVIDDQGYGRMSLSIDLSDMMAMMGDMSEDSTMVKTDTIITFKSILEEKKDSIAQLSKEEQKRLKAMEGYNIHFTMDPENKNSVVEIFTDFKNVSEANDLMEGLNQSGSMISGMANGNDTTSKASESDAVGVKFSFKEGVFKRDAYIIDEKAHQQQIDSLKESESFMSGITYKLKYTFPSRVINASAEDAKLSLDGKTIELERSFLEYIKNPDVLDLEVELEK